jgi:hypothetical protein
MRTKHRCAASRHRPEHAADRHVPRASDTIKPRQPARRGHAHCPLQPRAKAAGPPTPSGRQLQRRLHHIRHLSSTHAHIASNATPSPRILENLKARRLFFGRAPARPINMTTKPRMSANYTASMPASDRHTTAPATCGHLSTGWRSAQRRRDGPRCRRAREVTRGASASTHPDLEATPDNTSPGITTERDNLGDNGRD